MTQPPSGNDPVVRALDELVRSGQLAPERARAAYEASRGSGPPEAPAGSAPSPTSASDTEPSGPLRLDTVGVAIGTTLLATTIALSTTYARAESDLEWSNFGLGIIATLGLLGVAAAAFLMVKDDARKANLVAWPGALAAIGAGLMIGVAMDDNAATGYVAGLVTVAVGAGGFFVVRRGAFVVAVIIGLLVTYANLVDDVFGVNDDGGGDNIGIKVAAALLVFAVAVTTAGWSFPTRDISGVFVGAVTAFGFISVLAGLVVAALIQQVVGGLSGDLGGADAPDKDRFNNDVYVIVLFTLVLVAGWAVCSWLSGHVGYRVLILVTVTTVVPLATAALAVEHPSYWGLGAGILGAGVLAVVGMRAVGMFPDLGRRKPPPAAPPGGGGPIDLDRPA